MNKKINPHSQTKLARRLRRPLLLAALLTLLTHGALAAAQSKNADRAARTPARSFDLQEATIEDVHRAIRSGQLTATQLLNLYLNRIEAYNGRCVNGAIDPASGLQLGDITPIANAGQVNALMTLNLRGQRSKTDTVDNDINMPDARETAKRLDSEFARTGKLQGPLHGIPFAIKD